MEWVLVNPQIHSAFGSLGYLEGDTYHPDKNCQSTLEDILKKLLGEDRSLRTFRRAVGFGQNIKKDFVPILLYVKNNPQIVDLTIKILVNLTIPVECLLCIEEMSKNNVGRHTVYELSNILISSKEAFTESRATKAILDNISLILENEEKLTLNHIENINNCLLLLRNILHIPEIRKGQGTTSHTSSQNQILWNIFTQSIDKIILQLSTSTHGSNWSIAMVQLIALIFKDQHVGTLQKLLNIWFEASLSESSEDNESNTSLDQGSDDSSNILTSEPTSDSSDSGGSGNSMETQPSNGGHNKMDYQSTDIQKNQSNRTTTFSFNGNKHQTQSSRSSSDYENLDSTETETKNIEMDMNSSFIQSRPGKRGPPTPLSQLMCSGPCSAPKKYCISVHSEYSDCGYVTQNQESISPSSNEEETPRRKPFHQKHWLSLKVRPSVTGQDKKDKRRKKLVKRGKTNIINMKGLTHHIPTDEDISNVLKEFTVDFLLKGYGTLVKSLYTQLLFDVHLQIDTSHFFWLLTYFLKFAAQLELDLEHVNQVLSFEIISYLTYEGVNLCEQIQLTSKTRNGDLKSCLRRIHLVVTAIREFIQTIDTYKKVSHLNNEDRDSLVKLQIRIASSVDLRCLLVLLLRHYQPGLYNKQYLQDLIVTNHVLLLFLENATKLPGTTCNINMVEHIRQFATIEVIHQYGLLLEDFRSNGEFVNDCIFTIMHHIGSDLDSISTLFQPKILEIFSSIWATDFEICNDWSDLIDYVINTFAKTTRLSPPGSAIMGTTTPSSEVANDEIKTNTNVESWSLEELDSLNWNYMRSVKCGDVIDNICSLYRDDGSMKSRESVLEQLYKENIISLEEYNNLQQRAFDKASSSAANKESENLKSNGKIAPRDEVETLIDTLEKQTMKKALVWLQKILLEVCYAKIALRKKCTQDENDKTGHINHVIEPIPLHNISVNQSIPLVPWNNEQSTAIHNQTFLLLLHRLGFHLPVDSGKLFVRIPNFWTADILYNIANRLGPINKNTLKFSISEIEGNSEFSIMESMDTAQEILLSDTPSCSKTTTSVKHDNSFIFNRNRHANSLVQFTPLPPSNMTYKGSNKSLSVEKKSDSWLEMVMKSKPVMTTACQQSQRSSRLYRMDCVEEHGSNLKDPCPSFSPVTKKLTTQIPNYSSYTPIDNRSLKYPPIKTETMQMNISDDDDKQENS